MLIPSEYKGLRESLQLVVYRDSGTLLYTPLFQLIN
jgi:hypothetical protein